MFGTVRIPVAKNAVLPIIAASLMLEGETQIMECPKLFDIYSSLEIINAIESIATLEKTTLSILYSEADSFTIPQELCQKMRASILYISPILYRKGKIKLFFPGGCSIGKRAVDIHLDGLKAMGADVEETGEELIITAENGLKGAIYKLRLPSVGATQTLMMSAAVASGVTVLKNCAKEPEIVDLAHFLNLAGAKIMGAGKSEIIIKGVQGLRAVEYTPIPDRVFAATILSAVCACKGFCVIKNYPQENMRVFEEKLAGTGLLVTHFLNTAFAIKVIDKACDIETHTGYFPGLPTDMGPLLSAAMINNNGVLKLKETVFENRFSYAKSFEALGAYCTVQDNTYTQTQRGVNTKASFEARDLRAGAAIVVATLAKKGEFSISGLDFIDRGYENIEATFESLGADIKRVTDV